MNKNTTTLGNVSLRLTFGILTAFLILLSNTSNLHAQFVSPANFYNRVDGILTNVVTAAPGDTINYIVGINSEGGTDDVAIAMNFDPDLIQVQEDDIIDEIGDAINLTILEEVNNQEGNFTYIKLIIGSFFVGSGDFMSVNLIISDQITQSTTTSIDHILDNSVELPSQISLFGNDLLADQDAPSLIINVIVGTPDCENLENNIGNPCDDGNLLTADDTVTENCECIGTPVAAPCYPPELTLAIQDADSNPVDCLFAGEEFFVLATLSGGEGNDSYTFTSTNIEGIAVNGDGNSSTVLGPFTQGSSNAVIINATGIQNPDCVTEEIIWIPGICIPANNNCWTPTPLVCGEPMNGTTAGATSSNLNAPYCAPTGPRNDVFYTLTVTAGQEYTISITGPTYDGVLLIYRGSSCNNPLLIVCEDDGTEGETETRTFVANLNETLKIRTYDRNGAQTAFTITAECEPFDCPVLQANIDDICDDDNPLTTFDAINDDCECVGTLYDCLDLLANIGDPCDDGDLFTINDEILEDCTCAGATPPDGMFCEAPIAIPSLPYTTTDNTSNYGNIYNSSDLAPFASTVNGFLNGNFLNGNDAVYAYTPLEDGFIDISVTNHGSRTGVFVFTGCPFESTVAGFHSGFASTELTVDALPVTMGETYFVVISTWPNPITTSYTLNITPIFYDCPSLQAYFGDTCDDGDENTVNDVLIQDCTCAGTDPPVGMICEDPIEVTSLPYLTTDSTHIYVDNYGPSDFPALADNAIGNPSPNYLGGNDVVYAYTPSQDGSLDIKVTDQGSSTGLFVFSGCPFQSTLGGRTSISPNDLILLQFPVLAGETYYVIISSWTAPQTTSYTLSIAEASFDCPDFEAYFGDPCDDNNPLTQFDVLNENCECIGELGFSQEAAIPLECNADPVTYSSQNSNATKPPGSACSDIIGFDGLYFSFIGTGGDVIVNSSTNFHHGVQIRNQSGGITSCASGTFEFNTLYSNTVAGELYSVYVADDDEDGSNTGNITIDIDCIAIPDNDNCQNAIPLTCGVGTQGTTTGATFSDFGFPGCTEFTDSEDVFYSLDVTQGVEYTVSLNGGDAPGVLAIYSGTCDDFSEIQCAANFPDPEMEDSITFTAEASENLLVRVYYFAFPGNEFTITATCAQESCQDFVYYLADFNPGLGTDIYEVNLTGNNANITLLTNTNDEVHIAYNHTNNLLYLVSKLGNQYYTLNPFVATPFVSAPVILNGNYGQITGATFALNGDLLLADQLGDVIYSVNLNTNDVEIYDSNSPILGGDIAAAANGKVFMSTNKGNGLLYELFNGPSDVEINNVPISTGLAATDSDQLLLSVRNSPALEVYNLDGQNVGIYNLLLNGEVFTPNHGDMASGCNTYIMPEPDNCQDLFMAYADYDEENDRTLIYEIIFDGNTANLEPFGEVNFNASIAFNSDEQFVLAVPKSGAFTNQLSLTSISAVVYNPEDGLYYVGDDVTNAVYSYDYDTENFTYTAEFYANGFVKGGDLAITANNSMYLATQTGNSLYQVNTEGGSDFISTIPAVVTGAAKSGSENGILLSNKGTNVFTEIDASDGSIINVYDIMLDGQPFTTQFGDMASGCLDSNKRPALLPLPGKSLAKSKSTLFASPSPTTGESNILFTPAQTGHLTLEVYDMNGRNIATLFNREAQQNQDYRLQFNGESLPNGVYIYRLTTLNETIIHKFIIAN